MIIDGRLRAELNLIVQLVLAVALSFALRLALARDFKRHCALMNSSTDPLLDFEILIHHTSGLNGCGSLDLY